MWTIKTLETPDRISMTRRGDGGAFFGFLFAFAFAFLLWITIRKALYLHWFFIAVSRFFGLVTLFFFFRPNNTISEFDLNKRKFFISKTHFLLNCRAEEIRFEDIESIEVETHGGGSSGIKKCHLIVNLKLKPVGEDLGWVPRVEELQAKLIGFIGLPD